MRDSVGQYLHQIGQVPLLDKEQEIELAKQIEAGRQAKERLEAGETGAELTRAVRKAARAKEHFIQANLRLVVSIAKRYPLPPGMDLLDLVQDGNLGLEHAVDKFDHRKGFKFSTYATFWIRQSIGRALDQKSSLIRIPGERSAELRSALRANDGAPDNLDPHLADLHRLTNTTSLDRPIGEDGDDSFGDLLEHGDDGPEAAVVESLHEELLVGLLDALEPRTRTAVELRMGLTDGRVRPFREIGEDLDISAEAARRLVGRAMDRLREEALVLGLAA